MTCEILGKKKKGGPEQRHASATRQNATCRRPHWIRAPRSARARCRPRPQTAPQRQARRKFSRRASRVYWARDGSSGDQRSVAPRERFVQARAASTWPASSPAPQTGGSAGPGARSYGSTPTSLRLGLAGVVRDNDVVGRAVQLGRAPVGLLEQPFRSFARSGIRSRYRGSPVLDRMRGASARLRVVGVDDAAVLVAVPVDALGGRGGGERGKQRGSHDSAHGELLQRRYTTARRSR